MKKQEKILLIIITLISIFGLCHYKIVSADSGWDYDYDYDYDSGWDYDYDYDYSWDNDYDYDWDDDYDYDYSHSSSSSSSSGGSLDTSEKIMLVLWILIVSCIPYVIVYFTTKATRKIIRSIHSRNKINDSWRNNIQSRSSNYEELSQTKIASVDPTINIITFKSKVFDIYKDIQIAWMNFDTDTIRKLTTDEIYNMYKSQLETLKLKGQKNIMKDITLEEAKVIDIKKVNNIITVNVYMRVKCYDYVVKEEPWQIVRGRDKQKVIIEYVLSFVKSSTNNNKEEKCPNCGAPVEINSSSTCPYCESTLVKDSADYVMSKKTCVGQHLER